MINVKWGNRLEDLAYTMFDAMAGEQVARPGEVLSRRHCIVVPNRIVQHWLQHEFLFRKGKPRVLANCDFPLANVFVNDNLYQMSHPGSGRRDPDLHPFSRDALAWRLYRALGALPTDKRFNPLRDYLSTAAAATHGTRNPRGVSEKRRFKLAGRLAMLFDEYMVYRPEMLTRWESAKDGDLADNLLWQPALWRTLVEGELAGQTYLAAFRQMQGTLRNSEVGTGCNRIRVFGVSMLPTVYLRFFELLSGKVPVDFYVLNPCETDWFTVSYPKDTLLEGRLDNPEDAFDPGNALLGAQGRGNRNFLVELLDRTDGQAQADGGFQSPGDDTLLHALQSRILENERGLVAEPEQENTVPPAFRSVQLHVCHGPMREVEVLRDHLLRWFSEEAGLQPRHVQVLVSDMATYAPYIQAVFNTPNPTADQAMPFAIADRVAASESAVAEAFSKLLNLAESRFAAPEVLDLLQCQALREAFGIAENEVEPIKSWVEEAGIRWGRTRAHRQEAVDVDFDDYTTWRRGLDRLLLGYAYGRAGDTALPDGAPLPCDCVEGDNAVTLGRLARFVASLEDFADACAATRTLHDWANELDKAIGTFFVSTNETYQEVGLVRTAVRKLRASAEGSALADPVALAVVRDFVASRLQDVLGGDPLGANAVMFSALRPGSSVPREIVCLLGMADGQFPRSDNRPAYDLLRTERRFGDRSMRQEDRMAFLEAVLSARRRLYISYVGFDLEGDLGEPKIPPSVTVAELMEAFEAKTVQPVKHRLQPHHPAYFTPTGDAEAQGELFSYSATACETARALRKERPESSASQDAATPVAAAEAAAASPVEIELEKLIAFFKNPAKAFYTGPLGARLEIELESALGDQETFDLEGLGKHEVNTKIVDFLVEPGQKDKECLRRELLENGQLALGQRGKAWFEEQLETIGDVLNTTVDGLDITLKEALQQQRKASPISRTVSLELGADMIVRLTGTTVSAPAGNGCSECALDFRYTSDRAYERLACWIRHLFSCATGQAAPRYYMRKGNDKPVQVCFEKSSGDDAETSLNELVKLYRYGQTRILPFIPGVSAEYIKYFRKSKKGTENARRYEALAQAMEEWAPSYKPKDGPPPPCNDPYYRFAFGEAGPFTDKDRFHVVADSVFEASQLLIP